MRSLLDFKQKQKRALLHLEGRVAFANSEESGMFGILGDTEPSGSYHISLLQYSESYLF